MLVLVLSVMLVSLVGIGVVMGWGLAQDFDADRLYRDGLYQRWDREKHRLARAIASGDPRAILVARQNLAALERALLLEVNRQPLQWLPDGRGSIVPAHRILRSKPSCAVRKVGVEHHDPP